MSGNAKIEALSQEILQALDNLAGLHPGYRPVHAKGEMYTGTFTPAPEATTLTRAPHVERESTPVIVRFSDAAGIPTVPDNDSAAASPRGFAVRFQLGEHVHTDIIAHSTNGFPTRTADEFLEFLRAVAASGPDAPKPTTIETFLATHPSALWFVQVPKPIPTSFACESFFGVTALRFTNASGASRFGRFRILPESGNEYLDAASAEAKSPNFLFEELAARIIREPVEFRVVVQLAEPADQVDDATVHWPEDRPQLTLGTITLTECADDDPENGRIIFDPIPRVDGIDPSSDPLLEVRSAIYLLSGRRRRAASAQANPPPA
jgi:catalase